MWIFDDSITVLKKFSKDQLTVNIFLGNIGMKSEIYYENFEYAKKFIIHTYTI